MEDFDFFKGEDSEEARDLAAQHIELDKKWMKEQRRMTALMHAIEIMKTNAERISGVYRASDLIREAKEIEDFIRGDNDD